VGVAGILVAGMSVWGAGRGDMNLVLIPARVAMVQAAFDLARIRPATIVSCEDRQDRDPLLHVWDGSEWIRLDLADLAQGGFMRRTPARAIVIGGDDVMPASVVQAVGWCREVVRVPSMKPADIVNGLVGPLEFSRSDLVRLADRFRLNKVDLNAEQKARDPYSVPWSEILPRERRFRLAPAAEPKPAVVEFGKPAS